jgi:hypothetical protein
MLSFGGAIDRQLCRANHRARRAHDHLVLPRWMPRPYYARDTVRDKNAIPRAPLVLLFSLN